MPFEVVYGDILEQDVEAIVIPQVPQEGVLPELTARIYNAAGFQNMTAAYQDAKKVAIREEEKRFHLDFRRISDKDNAIASVTSGFNLKAKHAIHINIHAEKWQCPQTIGENVKKGRELFSCYYKALECAFFKLKVKSVALPLLGTSLLGFPEDISRKIAERAAVHCLEELTRFKTDGDTIKILIVILSDQKPQATERAERAAAQQHNPFTSQRPRKSIPTYLTIPDSKEPQAPKAPKPAASDYKHIFNPNLYNSPKNDFKDDIIDNFKYDDVFAGYENTFENSIKHSGKTKEEFCRTKCAEYLNRINEPTKLADLLGFHSSVITNFKKAVSAQGGGNIPREKRRVIAIAIYMGLSDYERFEFVRCSGFNYPGEEIDNHVETIIRSGTKAFRYVNKELCKINPDYDLTAPLRKNKPKPEKTR